PEPTVTNDLNELPPGFQQRVWSPIAATLITGEQDAILVDVLLTAGQAGHLANWVAAHGKHLVAVYFTDGHGDHWFGLSVILERFLHARAFAVPAVIARMRQDASPERLATWHGRFPGKFSDRLVLAEPLPEHTLALEGCELVAMDLGHTDTDNTTCLYAPEVGLVVAGDAAYNDVHRHLGQSSLQ